MLKLCVAHVYRFSPALALLLLCRSSCWAQKWWSASSLSGEEESWWRPEEALGFNWLLTSEDGSMSCVAQSCSSLTLHHLFLYQTRSVVLAWGPGKSCLFLELGPGFRWFIKIVPQLWWRIWLFPWLPPCLFSNLYWLHGFGFSHAFWIQDLKLTWLNLTLSG